jgi:hypothetical protein
MRKVCSKPVGARRTYENIYCNFIVLGCIITSVYEMMSKSLLHTHLFDLNACQEFCKWVDGKTAREAWETCDQPDWLLWWVGHTEVNTLSDIVRCAAKIARAVAHLNTDTRVMTAIESAEKWAEHPVPELGSVAAGVAAGVAAIAWATETQATAAAEAAQAAAEAAMWAARTMMSTAITTVDARAAEAQGKSLVAAWAAGAAAAADATTRAAARAPALDYCAIIRSCLKQPCCDSESS